MICNKAKPSCPRVTARISGWVSIAAIVGGFNRTRGALAGGLLIGVLDNITATYITAEYRAAVPLVLLIAIILVRPQGLLGEAEGRSV